MYVTVIKYTKHGTDPITLVETPNGARPDKRSFFQIFNDLERDGFKLVSSGGSAEELVFVFHKEGVLEVPKAEPKHEEGEKDEGEKKDKKDKKDKKKDKQ